MSNSVRPHRQQPTRLPLPWDSPGKNAGVGCHFFLQCMKVKSEGEVTQSCLTLRDPMDCSLPGSSVHGIFQARVLEWGAIAFSTSLYYISAILGCRGFGGLCQAPCSGQLHHLPDSRQNENTKLGRGWESQCPLPQGPQCQPTADSRSPKDGNLHAGTHVHTQSLDEWARNSTRLVPSA